MPAEVVTFDPGPLRGSVWVPGDKSISHRALIAGACCRPSLRISHLNPGLDVRATREALAALGIRIDTDGSDVVVTAAPLRSPTVTLDCMNSGSTVRMLLGACAGAGVRARFDGDDSLRRRPMEPVAAQLRAFGANIVSSEGHLPLELFGTPEVETQHFILLTPSAQVKSALLFAGLFGGVPIRVDGDRGSRDHTERLLQYLGAEVEWSERFVSLKHTSLAGGAVEIPGDFSAAGFFITAAAVTPGSALIVRDVGVNPSRVGLLEALRAMGAAVELKNARTVCGEPRADVVVEFRPLAAASIGPDVALRAIDEVPLITIAAAFAPGSTTIAGIADLRTKESDRIAAIERLLRGVGVEVRYERGALHVVGGAPLAVGGTIETRHDHRIAMAAAVLACGAGPLAIDSAESVDVSFPGFIRSLEGLRRG